MSTGNRPDGAPSHLNLLLKDKDEPIYTISIAAKLVRPMKGAATDVKPLHAQTLRMYEREGLVKPKRVGRNRLYSDHDIERLRQIQHYTQNMGVNLAGVEIILDLLERLNELQDQSSKLPGQ